MSEPEEFAPLRIVKKSLQGVASQSYRVYKSPTEFVTVEATTALEAFRESGIAQPLRIERESRFRERLLDQSMFADSVEIYETGEVVMGASPAITPHMQPVPQAAPAPVKAEKKPQPQPAQEPELSAAEIDALLGGGDESGKGGEY